MTKPKPGKTKRKRAPAPRLLYCSFCGKSQLHVRKLIAGPSALICDECTDVCVDIIIDADPKDSASLPRTRELFGKNHQADIDLAAIGVKPRFNKVKFSRRHSHIFYLCPFSEPFDTIYSDHIRPLARRAGFSIERADEIYGTQPIIEDIWECINSAEIIIADVTGRNPNVMYEIGMAHTVGRPVIILSQRIDDVPFDLKHHRCIAYSYTPRGCIELEGKVSGTLVFVKNAMRTT